MYSLVAITKCLAWYVNFLSRVFLVLERHELYPDGAVEAWTMALVGPSKCRTLQPHDVVTPLNAPPSPSLSSMWGNSLRVMGLARLIIIGRLLLLTLVVLSNPEQPTTLFVLCVHPDRLS